MEIDWITIAAQIVNFLVLVWLLKRFLYRPIANAIAAREEKIRDRLNDAARTKQEAAADAEKLRQLREDLESRQQQLIAEAKSTADQLRRELESDARNNVDAKQTAWHRQIEDERMVFVSDLRRRSVEHFYDLARAALGGLAGTSLNEAIANAFAERLSGLDEVATAKLREHAEEENMILRVETSFDLSPEFKERVAAAIHRVVAPETGVEFTLGDDLICGIRLKAGGQTIGWTLAGYLDQLEERALAGLDHMPAAEKRAAE